MNDLRALMIYVEKHPFEKVPALAAVDLYQERDGITRIRALRTVAKARRVGQRVKWYYQASALFRRRGAARSRRLELLARFARVPVIGGTVVVIIDGFHAPAVSPESHPYFHSGANPPIISVGARWVMMKERQLKLQRRELPYVPTVPPMIY